MPRLRFLIDDAPACLTQRAVLADFAASLEGRPGVDVLWSSDLRALPAWPDVPGESSRRLAVRLAALAPLADTVTVFLPAYAIPQFIPPLPPPAGWPSGDGRRGATLACEGSTAVADLDLFVVDNASTEIAACHARLQARPDYECASRYDAFTAGPLPDWLAQSGLVSARLFTRRPWYCAYAPSRQRWLAAVARALAGGRLTLEMVADDVRQGRVRPSLLEDVTALRDESLPVRRADLTLDALFVPPECRPTEAQRALLHSPDLQRRMLDWARRNNARKESRGVRPRRRARWFLQPLSWPVLRSFLRSVVRSSPGAAP